MIRMIKDAITNVKNKGNLVKTKDDDNNDDYDDKDEKKEEDEPQYLLHKVIALTLEFLEPLILRLWFIRSTLPLPCSSSW